MRVRRDGAEARQAEANGRAVGAGGDLDLLFAQLQELRELAVKTADDAGDTDDTGQVYDVSIRWGALLAGRFERLSLYHQRELLSPGERARFEALCAQLRETTGVLEHLGLARPWAATDAAPAEGDSRTESQGGLDPAADGHTSQLGELWYPRSQSHPPPVPLDAAERSRRPTLPLLGAATVTALFVWFRWSRRARSRHRPRRRASRP